MEAICSSETSVDIQRTTRRYIPEDSTLHYIMSDFRFIHHNITQSSQHLVIPTDLSLWKMGESKHGHCQCASWVNLWKYLHRWSLRVSNHWLQCYYRSHLLPWHNRAVTHLTALAGPLIAPVMTYWNRLPIIQAVHVRYTLHVSRQQP
jgi:hypothetical protein